MTITQRIQFDIPYEAYLQLIRHPDCPGWRGRNKFFCQMLMAHINSPEFKIGELEKANRRLARERDEKAKLAEFWKERAGGVQILLPPKPSPAPSEQPVESLSKNETNAA